MQHLLAIVLDSPLVGRMEWIEIAFRLETSRAASGRQLACATVRTMSKCDRNHKENLDFQPSPKTCSRYVEINKYKFVAAAFSRFYNILANNASLRTISLKVLVSLCVFGTTAKHAARWSNTKKDSVLSEVPMASLSTKRDKGQAPDSPGLRSALRPSGKCHHPN